jgi:hypothetical protein
MTQSAPEAALGPAAAESNSGALVTVYYDASSRATGVELDAF